ncbi:hypothetical protein MRBBS_1210 [Marinobacter sp. BSs20148]|nr:hypothetical protein MRBBS_1210 [Marinobacter sp. BSs20148]
MPFNESVIKQRFKFFLDKYFRRPIHSRTKKKQLELNALHSGAVWGSTNQDD